MSDAIYLKGKQYGPKNKNLSVAALADRAIEDAEGNNIKETYYCGAKNIEQFNDFRKNLCDGSGIANSIFMGRNLTERFNSGDLYAKIADGSFHDMFVGDYFVKSIGGANKTCRFAGFNLYKSSDRNYPNHVVIVPDEHFGEAKMNDTNTVVGAYKNSKIRKNIIPSINTSLTTAFGSDHLVTLKDYITSDVNSSIASPGYRGWSTVSSSIELLDSIADLMSEINVYGSRVWSSSGHDCGIPVGQFPLFRLAPQYINPSRFSWWLRDINQSTDFCIVGDAGNVFCYYASSTRFYVSMSEIKKNGLNHSSLFYNIYK